MSEPEQPRKGIIEGASRVWRELLRTPRVRQALRILLNELDPENTPLLLRVLQEQDPELFLSLLNSSPALANAAIAGADELLRQLRAFPPELFGAFVERLILDLDAERLGEALGLLALLVMPLADRHNENMSRAMAGFHHKLTAGFFTVTEKEGIRQEDLADTLVARFLAGAEKLATKWGEQAAQKDSLTAKTVDRLAVGVREIAERNPQFIAGVVKPLLEAGRAALAAADEAGVKSDDHQ